MKVLDYMLMPDHLAATNHLEGNANPLYSQTTRDSQGNVTKFAWIKDKSGHPWDINLVDANFAYLWITEWNDAPPHNYWANPRYYKKFINNGWLTQGVALFPLELPDSASPNGIAFELDTAHSQGIHVEDCTTDLPSTSGDIQCITHSPVKMSFGGNLPGNLETVVVEYHWGGKNGVYPVRERYFGAYGYGLVQWDTANLENGNYVVKQTTQYNKLTPGGGVTAVFPCF